MEGLPGNEYQRNGGVVKEGWNMTQLSFLIPDGAFTQNLTWLIQEASLHLETAAKGG